MTPQELAGKAIRMYRTVETDVDLRDCIASVIREAQTDAYQSVLSIVEEHKQSEAFVSLDELEDQIKGLGDGQ